MSWPKSQLRADWAYLEGDTEKSKVIWGADASRFSENNKEFYLTRNNYRNDVYLGQIADGEGIPILTTLTLDEKKTLLDCAGDDPRFAQAVQDYCIDDHSFIGKLQVTDGGTVVVEEDAALGNSTADLILEDGGLRVVGTQMNSLDRQVILEGAGWIDVADQDNNLTALQEITGDGALIKRGAGVLTLNGVHTYTGGTTIEEGRLVVGSAGNESASIQGDVNIGLNGFLGGIGSIGGLNVAKGGVITPGNSIGTLQVAGDAIFAAGSLYHLEIDADGNSDSIAVEGSATIDGANVYVDMAQGNYNPGTRYSILTAGTGVTGTFGDISQNYLFVEFDFAYDPNEVFLEVMRNDVTFASLALTKNQNAVALPLEALGAGSELYDAFVQSQSRDEARQALDLLSGEIHASVKTGLINSSADLRNAAQDRIRSALGDKTSQSGMQVVSAEDARAALWLQTYGSWTETSSNGNAAKFNQNTGGFFAGYDAEVGENARLGALAGYSRSSFNARDRASSGNANNYHLALYGGSRWGNTSVNGGVGYSRHTLDIDRAVWFSGVTDQLSSRYDASTVQAFGEVSHKLQSDSVVFEPFANLSYVSVKTDNVWEKGGAAALAVKGDTTNVTFTTLGVRAETDIMLGATNASLHGALGWQHGFGDMRPDIEAAFAEGTAFVVSGVPVAKNSALVQVGFDIKASERTKLSINYSGQFGSHAQKNSVNAALGVKF